MTRSYSSLVAIPEFIDRFRYLKLDGAVGLSTFGSDRMYNQAFYRSREWKELRSFIIVRDGCSDLACLEFGIFGPGIVHHINPVTIDDILRGSSKLLDPENLVYTSTQTHRAIHFGSEDLLHSWIKPNRSKGDTSLWTIKKIR